MKIFCEYCGAQFESEVANFCPACGAAFSDNDQIEHKLQHQKQLDRLEIEEQQMDLKERQAQLDTLHRRNRSATTAEKMSKGCLAAFIACGAIIVLTGVGLAVVQTLGVGFVVSEAFDQIESERREQETHSDSVDTTQSEEIEVPVSASFNEPAQTLNYSVICDSFEIVDRYPFDPTEGYAYVSFHLLVKNTSSGEIETTNDIICLADGVITTYTWHTDRKEMPEITLPAGVSAEGYMCFEVPVDAEEFELRYGDYVTIYIENDLMEREQQ